MLLEKVKKKNLLLIEVNEDIGSRIWDCCFLLVPGNLAVRAIYLVNTENNSQFDIPKVKKETSFVSFLTYFWKFEKTVFKERMGQLDFHKYNQEL